jgi:hypothetical protein
VLFDLGLPVDRLAKKFKFELRGVFGIKCGKEDSGVFLDRLKVAWIDLGGSQVEDDRRFVRDGRILLGDIFGILEVGWR